MAAVTHQNTRPREGRPSSFRSAGPGGGSFSSLTPVEAWIPDVRVQRRHAGAAVPGESSSCFEHPPEFFVVMPADGASNGSALRVEGGIIRALQTEPHTMKSRT
jgi:hypothetical protein